MDRWTMGFSVACGLAMVAALLLVPAARAQEARLIAAGRVQADVFDRLKPQDGGFSAAQYLLPEDVDQHMADWQKIVTELFC